VKRRSQLLALGSVALLLAFSLTVLGACDGKSKSEALPTISADQLREMEAIPDLSCQSCPAKAEVVSEEKLDASDAQAAIDANKGAVALYAFADTLGYHEILQGQKTTYTDGTVIDSAVIQSDEKGVAVLATRSGSTSDSLLIRLDPDNEDRLIVTDGKGGSATVAWTGQLIASEETHNSCHYWHCVGAAVSWLYSSSWYASFLGAFCHQCAQSADEFTCGICLASLPSGLFASVADCGIDSCDYCSSDSCGDDVVTSTQCHLDPSTIGSGLTPIYGIYQTVDDYGCQNPGQGNSQCVMTSNVVNKVQVCPGDCALDGVSCALATPRACDAEDCAARSTITVAPHCNKRSMPWIGGRKVWYEVWWTGRPWSCQPDGAGGSVCVPGAEGSYYSTCPDGWGCSDGTCIAPTATPTRTPRVTATVALTATATRTPKPTATATKTPVPRPTGKYNPR
jgi:hypothetical protein